MANENEVEEKILVKEEQDGSVTVDLPDNIPSPDNDEDAGESMAAGGAADEDDQDRDDDTEAIRAARRNRRKAKKEYIKKTNEEKDQRLQMLQRQNQDLMERLSNVERKTHSADLARLDKAIEDKELRLQYARMKMSEATSAGDGEAFAKAQEMWYETRREVESMKSLKDNAVRSVNVDSPANSAELQRQAARWMQRNDWFNPEGSFEF